ncbi:MAG TPA: ABC transporter substrate-binding protein [Beijerinckiaceae bacterium]|nr:ABC transporter substrate-binding protein [Beijerinckiaceae bacterium]
MRRREFLAFAAAAPLGAARARAQTGVPVVGFLNPVSPDTYGFTAAAFREGLARAGFVEGRNVRIAYRWGRGDYGRLPALARELAALNVAAIAATGDIASARAAQAATRTIPIVFTIGADPVRHGLVASLARPGGNTTGIHLFSSILSAKRIEFLVEMAPKVRRIALIMNPDNFTAEAEQQQGLEGARALGREAFVVEARHPHEMDAAFSEIRRRAGDSYITASDPLILDRRAEIVRFGQENGLAGIGFVRQFAALGALASYGPSIVWMYERAGLYVGEILKGAKPAELPVLQPTEFETVINLKAAQALNLDPPPLLLARATEIIE